MKINFLILFITLSINGITQKQTTKEYIEKWKYEAIVQMNLYKIPASITLAQGILESGNGNSLLATEANNHFGIKCHTSWTGKTFYQDDDKKDECFRKYKSAKESFKDHSVFLQKTRYKALFELKITDYKRWAKGLKKAGYATNPKYPKLLIGLIERYNLTQYDKKGGLIANVPEKKPTEPSTSTTKTEEIEITFSVQRKTFVTANRVPFILVKKGDTYKKLVKDLEIREWEIRKYNDFTKDHKFRVGEKIYTKPKRNKAKEEFHYVKKGETMHSISQLHAIKLNKLYKKNRMKKGAILKIGKKLHLRKRVKRKK